MRIHDDYQTAPNLNISVGCMLAQLMICYIVEGSGVISQCFNSEMSLNSSRPWLPKINYDDLHMLLYYALNIR